MIRFRIARNTPVDRTQSRHSLANEFARLRLAGKTEADALRILFDMVTENAPVPEIDQPQGGRAS